MTIEQMRERLGAIAALLAQFAEKDLTIEDVSEVEALNAEFEETTKKIEAKEKMAAIQAKTAQTTRQTVATPVAKVEVGPARVTLDPKRGFKNEGEFYAAVVRQGKTGRIEEKLQAAGLQEKSMEDGGVLIPEDFRLDIQRKLEGDESLLPRTTQFVTGSNSVRLPTYEQAFWDGTQGIQAYWTEESGNVVETKPKFGEFAARLHKLTAKVRLTEELMEDQALLESWIRQNAPGAIVQKINAAIIDGSGAGTPEGLLKSSFKVKVAKEVGQAADTIVWQNINKMYAAMNPASIVGGRAMWLANPAIMPVLRNMAFDPGATDKFPIYMPGNNIAGQPFGTLMGLGIMPMMGGLKALGDEGDLILVDMSAYYSIVKSGGIRAAISTHVHFDTDEVALKFVQRVGGGVPYKSPITNQAGDFTCAGIVTLADRA